MSPSSNLSENKSLFSVTKIPPSTMDNLTKHQKNPKSNLSIPDFPTNKTCKKKESKMPNKESYKDSNNSNKSKKMNKNWKEMYLQEKDKNNNKDNKQNN